MSVLTKIECAIQILFAGDAPVPSFAPMWFRSSAHKERSDMVEGLAASSPAKSPSWFRIEDPCPAAGLPLGLDPPCQGSSQSQEVPTKKVRFQVVVGETVRTPQDPGKFPKTSLCDCPSWFFFFDIPQKKKKKTSPEGSRPRIEGWKTNPRPESVKWQGSQHCRGWFQDRQHWMSGRFGPYLKA